MGICGLFLIVGNAGYIPSTVVLMYITVAEGLVRQANGRKLWKTGNPSI